MEKVLQTHNLSEPSGSSSREVTFSVRKMTGNTLRLKEPSSKEKTLRWVVYLFVGDSSGCSGCRLNLYFSTVSLYDYSTTNDPTFTEIETGSIEYRRQS